MRQRLFIVGAAAVTCALVFACTPVFDAGVRGRADQPEQRPVSSRADQLLSRAIALAETDHSSSGPSRLAHLKMTEAAADQIAQGNLERAVDLLERALAIEGRVGFAYFYLARAHLALGSASQSLEFNRRAAALLPNDRELARELRDQREAARAMLAETRR